jgi:hypothetical protein
VIQKKNILLAASHSNAPTAAPIRALRNRTLPVGISWIISSRARKMKIEGRMPVSTARVLPISSTACPPSRERNIPAKFKPILNRKLPTTNTDT